MSLVAARTLMRRRAWWLRCAACLACIWVLLARSLGPDDLFDQSQPLTIGYTTDVVRHGHWVLPYAFAEQPATKPPLYNWIAAPAVALGGCSSVLAHKAPSVLALLATTVLTWLVGRRLAPGLGGVATGSAAATIWLGSYEAFKLGWLARPDMLLTACLTAGWLCGTLALLNGRRAAVLGFWCAAAAAGLAKGPAVLVLLAFAPWAARAIRGEARAVVVLRPLLGLLWLGAVLGGWFVAVWLLEPAHAVQTLIGDELVGRVLGTGAEGTRGGTVSPLYRLPTIGLYYIGRFAPWSIVSLVAIACIWSRRGDRRRAAHLGAPGAWLQSAAIFVIVTLAIFTLSVGKRGDYVAPALPPGAVLAAWWLFREAPRAWRRCAATIVPAGSAIVLALATVDNALERDAPVAGFGRAISRMAREAELAIAERPAPVAVWSAGQTHLQALAGVSVADDPERAAFLASTGMPFWLLLGAADPDGHDAAVRWIRQRAGGCTVTVAAEVRGLPASDERNWPGEVALLRIEP